MVMDRTIDPEHKASAPVNSSGVENIEPELLQQILSLNENEVIVPLRMQRQDVSKVKAVKLSDEELVKVSKLQMYLYDREYIPDNTFASLFVYMFNLAFTLHKQVAEHEAKREVDVR